jgi:hypothetical protein
MTQSYSHRPKADWPAPGHAPLKRPRWPAILGISAGVMVLLFPVGAILLLSHLWGVDKPPNQLPTPTVSDPHPTLAAAYTACGSKGLLTTMNEGLYMNTSTGTVNRADIGCVLDKLDAPPSVSAEIDQTPAGKLGVDEWGPFSINWQADNKGNLNVSIMDNRS